MMQYLKNIPYKEEILIDPSFQYQDCPEKIYLYKAFSVSNPDYYYLRLKYTKEGEEVKQGYLYFYLDFEKKVSQFIGLAIAEEFRGNHLSTLLLSIWIQFCLEQGFSLATIEKQRKPFLVYLLKKFHFDLENMQEYTRHFSHVISICQKQDENTKYLWFHNNLYQKEFSRSKIMRSDNYQIVSELFKDMKVLDDVLLLKSYLLKEEESAYQKAYQISKKYR